MPQVLQRRPARAQPSDDSSDEVVQYLKMHTLAHVNQYTFFLPVFNLFFIRMYLYIQECFCPFFHASMCLHKSTTCMCAYIDINKWI